MMAPNSPEVDRNDSMQVYPLIACSPALLEIIESEFVEKIKSANLPATLYVSLQSAGKAIALQSGEKKSISVTVEMNGKSETIECIFHEHTAVPDRIPIRWNLVGIDEAGMMYALAESESPRIQFDTRKKQMLLPVGSLCFQGMVRNNEGTPVEQYPHSKSIFPTFITVSEQLVQIQEQLAQIQKLQRSLYEAHAALARFNAGITGNYEI